MPQKFYSDSLCWILLSQIAWKFSLKFRLCITNLERLIKISFFFLVGLRVSSACVQPADSTPARLNSQIPSVEAQQKT